MRETRTNQFKERSRAALVFLSDTLHRWLFQNLFYTPIYKLSRQTLAYIHMRTVCAHVRLLEQFTRLTPKLSKKD